MQHTPRLSALSLALASLFTTSAHAAEATAAADAAPQEMQKVEAWLQARITESRS